MNRGGRAPAAPLAEAAGDAIADIAERLDSGDGEPTLALGEAGAAVALIHLGRQQAAQRALDRALAGLAGRRLAPGLMDGVAGVAWASAHLARLQGAGLDDAHDDVDAALLGWVRSPSTREFDLVGGLVGVGIYALERLPDPAGRELLEAVTAALADRAERTSLGACWRRGPGAPVDLGMAHGCAGVIALLAAVPGTDTTLLAEAVAFLLAHEGPSSPYGRYPSWIDGEARPPARLAWCYGDLGISCALGRAAQRAGVEEWRERAIDLARSAARRRGPETAVVDAGLCHGAAGVAHLFGRLADAFDDASLREAADFWLERALAMRRPGTGFGGYVAVHGERRPAVADPGYLMGAAGVALALRAALDGGEASWDRALLVSPLDTDGSSA